MGKTQKTEAELHADLVTKLMNGLEGILAEEVKAERYEAAEILNQSVSLIKSSHILNDYLTKENAVLKKNLRLHLAGLAMTALIGVNMDKCTKTITEKAFQIADEMLLIARK